MKKEFWTNPTILKITLHHCVRDLSTWKIHLHLQITIKFIDFTDDMSQLILKAYINLKNQKLLFTTSQE